jgi:hypothetical protein
MSRNSERSTIVEPREGDAGASASGARSSRARDSAPPPEPVEQRVTVNLNARAVRALAALVDLTGYNKTDVINRALQIYEFAEQIKESGGSLHIRQSEGADLERLTFF